ncbi:LD-carboxypeptidase [Paenibacillus aurantius]|uniref:LD-carboxypeptidase n=1 Tax=Paenibacillus aurantius TaxID=2918900 RepID=A0AA96LKW2_9BACL|nr:LD-carboxypeptidase [Paenibacillus aurantius]WNQ13940.1 LD-carboxypeptidase [Paenibacillus aurantius]
MERIKPKRLLPGDTVAVTAPASWGDRDKTEAAAGYLERLGLNVILGETTRKKHGYLAGTDAERADELNRLFADESVKAIVCARGGYGTGRIAPMLDYAAIRANPKIFWGYSDITFLHSAIGRYAGLVTFHGPMLIDLGREDLHPATLEGFRMMLEPVVPAYGEELSPLQVLVEGEAEGELTGGNVSLLTSTLGTPYEIDTRGKILFLEDIDEEPYRLDRMFNQLKQAGKFDDAAGIAICDFHNCEPNKRKESLTLEQVIGDHILTSGKPTLAGFRIGHCSPNAAVPVGIRARLSTRKKLLEGLEPGVQA